MKVSGGGANLDIVQKLEGSKNSRGQVGLVKSKFELYKTHLTPDFFLAVKRGYVRDRLL